MTTVYATFTVICGFCAVWFTASVLDYPTLQGLMFTLTGIFFFAPLTLLFYRGGQIEEEKQRRKLRAKRAVQKLKERTFKNDNNVC